MPNPFDEFGFAEGEESGGTGNPFEQFGFEESAEAEPVTAQAPEEAGYLDQLRGGYFELRKNLAASGAVDRLETARDVEKGELALNEFGSVIPGSEVEQRKKTNPKSLATPERTGQFVEDQFQGAAENLTEAGEFQLKAEKIPFSNETLDFLDESRGVPAGEAFKKAPFKIIAEIGLRSGVNSVPSLVAGAAGGAAGGIPGAMAGAGAASARLEYVNSLIDGLQQKGVDVLNVDALKEAVENPELMREVEARALKRGAAIGAFDAATFGVAGTTLTPFKNTAARVGGNLVAQGAVQAAGGAAGEKAAQLATGERDDRAVYAEAAGEYVSAFVDVPVAAAAIAKGDPAVQESPLADSEAAQARAREAAAQAGGDPLEQELAAAQVQAEATAKLADELNRQASVDKAMARIAELTAEMEQAESPAGRDAIQQAEQRVQEELQGGEAARAVGFDQAAAAQAAERAAGFERAEAATAQQREAEVATAEVQKQEQLAAQPLTEPVPQRPLDRATTSLAEVGGEVFRTLQERRAAQTASVPQASTPTPVAPAVPKTLAERRAREAAKKQPPPAASPAATVTPAPKPKPAPAPKAAAAAVPAAQASEPVLNRTPKALQNKPKVQEAPKPAAQAQPALEQEPVIEEDETGEVRASNESVEILAQENQGFLQVKRADAKPGAKGKGRGVALYERLAQQAQAKGLTLASDFSVSPDAVEVYRALERRGFEVTRNPSTVNAETGNLVSADPRKPVFEVRPKKRGIGARSAAKTVAPATVTERKPKAEVKSLKERRSAAAQPSVKEQADAQYEQDLPSRGGLTSMPIERTRAATKADKTTFDQEMLTRAKAGEIELIPYDDVKQLTPAQRAAAIQDPQDKSRVYSHWRPTKPAGDFRESDSPRGWGMAEAAEEQGTSVENAREQLAGFIKEFGPDAVTVVNDLNDVPADVAASISKQLRGNLPRGVRLRADGKIYIFAKAHSPSQSVLETAVHEYIAHEGLRKFLGKERESVFIDVFKNAKSQYAKDFKIDYAAQLADRYNAQTGRIATIDQVMATREYQIVIADELLAYMAENIDFEQPLLQRFFDAMRAVLRKLGLVRAYTDSDLRRLLRASRAKLRQDAAARGISGVTEPEMSFATDLRTPTEDRNPLGSINGMGLTMEDQANYSPGFVTSRMNALKDFGQNNIQRLLAFVPRRNLVDFIANGKLPSMRKYLNLAERMDGRRNELMAQTETLANRWVKYTRKNKKNARILGELMNASTLAGVDPLESYTSSLEGKKRPTAEQRQLEAERRAAYDALKKYADRLDPEAQAIYREVRDSYASDRVKIMAGIEERINAAAAEDQVKRTLLNEIRKKFESGKVAGPYFPLARFGKHWAVAKDADGSVLSFVRSDSPSEIAAWRAQMKEAGLKTDGGEQMTNPSDLVRQVDPNFAAKVAGLAKEFDQELADQIWQMYLQSLPETSLRKQFVHRQGRLGFTADTLRAFGHIKFHAAHQIAKLEFMHRMEAELQQMQVEARSLEEDSDPEAKWASPLVKEMDARHQWARNPENSAWANNLTALGFAYYLGVTPAAALVNLAQTPMVAYPTISAEYGWTKTGKELLRASAQWASSWGPLANRLRGDERAAFDEALRVGLFSQTRTADLAGIGQQGEDIGSARQTFMKVISWTFQFTEQANREITFLAAYRLAKDAGLSQEAAIEQGRKLTDDSHFQYQNTNRPRVMQGDAKKVLFLFRQYSTNMTYRLARDFRNSTTLQELPAGERGKAIQRLVGLLGMTFLNAGVSGLPMLWLGFAVISAMMGDEDEPYDAEAALRAWLEEQGGEDWASRIMDGTVASAADVTLSTRVGLGNLWLQDKPDNLSTMEEFGWWSSQVAGPIGGMVFSGMKAADLDTETYGDRALETLAPKAARDVLQTARFAREGVTNKRGDALIARGELSSYDLFVKSIGFQPLEITQQYGKNRAIKEEEKTIQNRRATLMNRIFLAAQNGDRKTVQETRDAIREFNKTHRGRPNVQIDITDRISSARARSRYSEQAINGITVQRGYRYLNKKYGNQRRPKETEE
jgi:GNAT superfamily N-acetyltransferase